MAVRKKGPEPIRCCRHLPRHRRPQQARAPPTVGYSAFALTRRRRASPANAARTLIEIAKSPLANGLGLSSYPVSPTHLPMAAAPGRELVTPHHQTARGAAHRQHGGSRPSARTWGDARAVRLRGSRSRSYAEEWPRCRRSSSRCSRAQTIRFARGGTAGAIPPARRVIPNATDKREPPCRRSGRVPEQAPLPRRNGEKAGCRRAAPRALQVSRYASEVRRREVATKSYLNGASDARWGQPPTGAPCDLCRATAGWPRATRHGSCAR